MASTLRQILPVSLGLLLIASFIWFAGPYFAFAEYRPLESVLARLVAILLVVAAWGATVLFRRMRANRASDKLVAAVVEQSNAAEGKPAADAVQLRERFEEAVATLKQKRRGGHSLYDLPWFVIVGAPGSGKTTALVNSGLHFPLEQKSGRGALRGIGGTRNCDWWFTEEAVFLDTAGRYLTQDSDATADKAGWLEFLSLLRKYRKRRPVNGVILTLSAHDLMTGHGGEAYVEAARRRLSELYRELRIQLPVYLMVTKCDLIAGFTEHFDDLTQEGRAQVWGVTFPYDDTLSGQAPKRFPAEFDALVERLNGRLFARVEEDRDVRRRTGIFGFPQQLMALREGLTQFVDDVFTTTRFDERVLLRGVYFTSGTQEGTPIDRLLGAIARRFAVSPDAVVPAGRGKAYFIERLLKEVLLAESGLAGVNRRLEFQKAALQLGAYAAMAAIAVIGVILLSVSYARNSRYIEEVGAEAARLRDVPPVPASAASLDAALPRLDAVRRVVDVANRYADDPPLGMRWGLFQGRSFSEAARAAYERELDGALLSHVANRFRQRLIDYAARPETLYAYLKGYLMLGNPEHLEKNQLAYLANVEWEAAYGADPDRRETVSQHFRALLDSEERLRPVTLDESIVAQARGTLRQASRPGLVYRYIRIEYARDTARALRLDQEAGLGAERVLRRRNGVGLSEPIPAIYTKPVFQEITGTQMGDFVRQFEAEDWVWGERSTPVAAGVSLQAEVLDLYEKDYIAFWDEIVNGIQAVPLPPMPAAKDSLAILSGPTSPLRGILKVVADNTSFEKPPEPKPADGGFTGRIGAIFETGREAAGVPALQPGAQITAHFAPIHRLVAGEPGSAPIDGVLRRLGELQQKLQPLGVIGGDNPASPQVIRDVSEIATGLRREVAPLPPSVGAIVTQVASGAANIVRGEGARSIESRYQQAVVGECNLIVTNRYPFMPGPDVPLEDFGRLFGYGGVYDAFFREELANLVDVSRGTWRWMSDSTGQSIGGSTTMLRKFEMAERIREAFFRPGTQMVALQFTVTPLTQDRGTQRFILEIDGQSVDYRFGPEIPRAATWPGPKPGSAVATFEERSGARTNIPYDGAWAWFKLMDAAQVERESDTRYVLTFSRGEHNARVRIEAPSIRNPYGKRLLQEFRCG